MDIYTYAGFSYGLTAVISLLTIGFILLLNEVVKRI